MSSQPYLAIVGLLHCAALQRTGLDWITPNSAMYCTAPFTVLYCPALHCFAQEGTNLTSYLGPLIFEPTQTLWTDSRDKNTNKKLNYYF